MTTFWIVMRDKKATTINKRHETFEDARREAERLCEKDHAKFFVLGVAGMAVPDTRVIWEGWTGSKNGNVNL